MNKANLFKRLFIFFVGVPIILLIVLLRSHAHLALHIFLCLMCAVGANELYNICETKTKLLSRIFVIAMAVMIPFAAGLYVVIPTFLNPDGQNVLHTEFITYTFIVAILLILAAEVLTAKSFEQSVTRLASCSFIVLYVGYLLTFISRMSCMTNQGSDVSSQAIVTFLLMVFLCDSLAWLFGNLLGKNNRGFIKASPNKSIAGFIGGFVGSIAAGLLCCWLYPELFNNSIPKIIFLSISTAFSSIVGDLAESIFKRSAGIKDSGNAVPGRGGVLDTIDSILMSAPVYYFLLSILYNPR